MALVPTEKNLAKVSQPEHSFLEEHSNGPKISVTGDMQQTGGPYRQNGPLKSECQECMQCNKKLTLTLNTEFN